MTTRRWTALTGAAVMLVLLSGCFAPPSYLDPAVEVADDSSARAVVDANLQSVALPLDDYLFDPAQSWRALQAHDVLVGDCLVAEGFERQPWILSAYGPDREYYSVSDFGSEFGIGLWSIARAERWGFGSAPLPGAAQAEDDEATRKWFAMGEAWQRAESECATSIPMNQYVATGYADAGAPDGVDFVVAGIRGSEEYVRESAEFDRLAGEFATCVRAAGYEPRDTFGVEVEADSDIPRAIAVATCHTELDTVQQLADVAARYQEAYVDAYPEELGESMALKNAAASENDAVASRADPTETALTPLH